MKRDWLIVTDHPPALLVRREAERIARAHGLTLEALQYRGRTACIVAARKDVAVAARGLGLSYPQIGRLLRRHHSTVMEMMK